MTSGHPSSDLRCTATSKRTGQRCGRAAIPFAEVCTVHGGYAPTTLEAADRRRAEAERGMSGDPPLVVRENLRRWYKFQERLARRKMRRAGVDLAEYDREQARLAREDQAARTRALRELAPEYVAEQRRRARAVKEWVSNGRQGPMPALTADEEPEGLPVGVRDLLEPSTEPEPTTESHADPEPVEDVEPEPERLDPSEPWRPRTASRPQPEPEPARFLERRGETARARRKRPRQQPSGEALPSGGRIYDDVQPEPAGNRPASTEPVFYPGFDFDWDL